MQNKQKLWSSNKMQCPKANCEAGYNRYKKYETTEISCLFMTFWHVFQHNGMPVSCNIKLTEQQKFKSITGRYVSISISVYLTFHISRVHVRYKTCQYIPTQASLWPLITCSGGESWYLLFSIIILSFLLSFTIFLPTLSFVPYRWTAVRFLLFLCLKTHVRYITQLSRTTILNSQ